MRQIKPRPQRKALTPDKTLLSLIFFLLFLGIIFIYNSTVIYSQGLFGGAYRFVILQIAWVAVGLLGFLIFLKFDYKNIGRFSFILFTVTLMFLLILAVIGILPCSINIIFAPCINGVNRWFYLNPAPLPKIPLFGVLGFQPSELAKLGFILYLAVQLNKSLKSGNGQKKTLGPFLIFIITSVLISFLVLLQPNMSTSVILFLIGCVMYIVSDSDLRPLLLTLPLFMSFGVFFMVISPYRRERLFTFLSGENVKTEGSSGYHIRQILIALGSGGFFGVGFGQSRQKFQYLPEVAADSIFAIIAEEFGFLGTTFLISVFLLLIFKGYKIAKNAPDMLGKLLAAGITTWIGIQFFVNIAAMTKIIPLTGVPIPLISYGGSSTVFSLMGLGILANISSHENSDDRRTS